MNRIETHKVPIRKQNSDGRHLMNDDVAVEEPLEIYFQHQNDLKFIYSTMRTPGTDVELAIGHIYAESILPNIDIKDYRLLKYELGENKIIFQIPSKIETNYEKFTISYNRRSI